MRKADFQIPTRLKNGNTRPKGFEAVIRDLKDKSPRYKIIAYSISPLGGWRLVHWHYISLVDDDDPSQLQTFMRSVNREATRGFEDGRFIGEMMAFVFHLDFDQMINLAGKIGEIVKNNSTHYARVAYDAIVQYSDRYGENTVYNRITALD